MKSLQEKLKALEQHDQLRTLRAREQAGGKISVGGHEILNFSSNDYLGLSRHPALISAAHTALEEWGCGATASRLVCGHLSCHAELEEELADWMGTESALVFGSGFLANVGVLTSLAGRGERILADRLNHASLIDGMRFSGAGFERYAHADIEDLSHRLARAPRIDLIVTDSVFSMDGDRAPLLRIQSLAQSCGATLYVDEAHALGVLGPTGCGLREDLGIDPRGLILVGTMSKALGGYGGFVVCDRDVREYLVNHARSLIYSTALPPVCATAALAAVRLIRKAAGGLGEELMRRAALFAGFLREAGISVAEPQSAIIPIILGDNTSAVSVSRTLEQKGIWAPAIRPPTVPAGTARLRLSVTLDHGQEDLERAAETIGSVLKQRGSVL
jgi:8-amino-7-oxononanoate synthase